MAIETLWEGVVGNGLRLKLESTNGGVTVTLYRLTAFLDPDGPPRSTWLMHCQLAVWWPGSADEAIRIISHWLDFYDQTLKLHLGPLANKLATMTELKAADAVPPQRQGPPN